MLVDLVQRVVSDPEAATMLALWRLDRDPVAGRVAPERRRELVADARAAGATLARRVRAGQRGPVEARLGLAGVRIVEDDGTEQAASLIHHAVYTSPPPTVTLYRRVLAALEHVVTTEGLRTSLGEVDVRELILTHELFHHVIAREGAPAGVRPSVDVVRLGPWRRRATVHAAEEIAAAAFVTTWHQLSWPAGLLDLLTLVAYEAPPAVIFATLVEKATSV